jgi:predicted RNA binding protein YcfA (HicA-like mRNA interferase family)
MPRLYNPKHIIKVLEKNGFVCVSQNGSHLKLKKEEYTVIVPVHSKEIPVGTFRSLVRQSGLIKDIFK